MEDFVTQYKISNFWSLLTVTKSFPFQTINEDSLSNNLTDFLNNFQNNLRIADIRAAESGFEVDEIELNLGVNAGGSISVIAKLEVGAQAGIKVKFKKIRKKDD